MAMFTFSVLDRKYSLWANLFQKIEIASLSWTNSNMHNSMVMFISSALDRKYPFWTSLVQKVKVVSLS